MADGPQIGTAYLRVMPDTSGLNARMAGYFRSSDWGKLGKAAGGALAAGIAAAGAVKALYEVGQAFDTAYDTIRTTTGATGKELKKLEGDFKAVVKSVPTDFDTAAEAVSGLNQRLDLTGKPLRSLSRQMTELSRITGTDITSNVRSVTRLFGDWSVKTGKQEKTLDGLFRLTQETGIEFSDLADTMVQFGSPMRTLGLDFDFAASMIAKFEKEGVNMTTLMSGLRLSVANLSDPTDELEASFKKFGITAKEPAEQVFQVMEAIKETASVTKGNTLAFEVFGRRAGSDMAAAIREGRFELDDLMKTMESGKETIRGAGRETMDFSEHWLRFKNNVLVLLEPVATRVFEALGDGAKKVSKFLRSADFKGFGEDVKEFFADVEPVTDFLKNVLGKAFDGLKHSVGGVVRAIGGLGQIVGGLLTGDFGKAWEGVKDFIEGIVQSIKGTILTITAPFRALAEKIGGLLKDGPVGDAIRWLGDKIEWVIDKIKWAFDQLPKLPGAEDVGVNVTTHRSWLQDEFDLTLEGAKRVEQWMRKHPSLGAEDALDAIRKPLKNAKGDYSSFGGDTVDILRNLREKGGKEHERLSDKAVGEAVRGRKGANRESGKLARGVTGNLAEMVNTASGGLITLRDNLGNALSAFEVKKANFSIKVVKKTLGTMFGQRGGDVPGFGIGDKVPAMLEPGEFVVNKNASSAMRPLLEAINSRIPRFASGGWVDPAGPGTGVVNPAIAKIVGQWSRQYNAAINYGFDPGGGHRSPGHNVTGTATDTGPAAGWTAGPTALFERGLRAIEGKVSQILYGTAGIGTPYPNHGRGNHAHIEWGMHPSGGFGAIADIARVILQGPDGPLKRGGQGALDKAWKGAKAFLAKQAGSIGGADFGPQGGGILGKSQLVPLWNRTGAGGNANLMAAIALAESGGNPNVTNSIGARGLWQIMPGTASAFGLNYGRLTDPVLNAKGAHSILAGQGLGAWEAYTTGAHQQFMQKGGEAGGRALNRAGNLRGHLGSLMRRIGMTDERIDIAQRLAGTEWSPGGTELSAAERDKQLKLLRQLRGRLNQASHLSRAGMGMTRGVNARGGKGDVSRSLFSGFKDIYQEVSGVTGRGGRRFDTDLAIRELKATPLAGALGAMGISQFQEFADAIRLGAFSHQMPPFGGIFAQGGTVPGPVGAPRTVVAHGGETIGPADEGPWEMTITNWDEGRVMISRTADRRIQSRERETRDLVRRGSA